MRYFIATLIVIGFIASAYFNFTGSENIISKLVMFFALVAFFGMALLGAFTFDPDHQISSQWMRTTS